MPVSLYVNDGDSSPENSENPSLCSNNRLDLLPEHLAQIGNAFILQLSLARLKAQETRILSAIYSQTIGYNKREDDMNGTRLEQLTGIRSDHANEAVRRLEALNIIITHAGNYGKWMSINFDFVHWGEKHPESQTNDPSCLLSERYQTILPDDELQFQLHYLPESTSVASRPDATTGIEQQQQSTISPDFSQADAKPAKPSRPSPSFDLHFPDSFSEKLRESITDHLKGIKIPQQAQRLLDYFSKCLLERNIRNPIAYFIGLKNRLLKGQLDLPEDKAVVEENKKVNQELIERRLAYQEAILDHEQLKKCIQLIMDAKHCTFDKALQKIGYNALWKKACQCLETTQKALRNFKAYDHSASRPIMAEEEITVSIG